MIFRASSVGKIMASADKNILPVGAITEINELCSQQLLDWRNELDVFTIQKGIQCENESIELYNDLNDTFYIKNLERVTKGNLTGECDLLDVNQSLVIDIKTAYSKKTYPLFLKMSSLYEWQLRAYMYLYDVNHAELAYCLVNTPLDLIAKKDNPDWHNVDLVPMHLKVSTLRIERDELKEQQLLNRIKLASEYAEELIEGKKNEKA